MRNKYRVTPHVNGITGLITEYRQTVESAQAAGIGQAMNNPITASREGHIMIYERKYRKIDNQLFWKPLRVIHLEGNGKYTVKDRDGADWDQLYGDGYFKEEAN